MYNKIDPKETVTQREDKVSKFWDDNEVFLKSIKERDTSPFYTFYDGPPTANGKPHIGHVITRAIKDLFPRYKTMQGYKVLRKAGWDTHGLPVELEVEKLLGFSGKEKIEEYGIAPFIDKCKESVWKYEGMWEEFSKKVGFWADFEHPYITYKNEYIESEWWALKQIFDKGLLYKGYKIVPYCPRCGTPLASHEVAQGYKDVKERSAIAKFKLVDDDAFVLAWTTTPWTLPSNVALCVNANFDYVKVAVNGEKYILAKDLVKSVFKEDDQVEILSLFKGSELEYKKYIPLYESPLDKEGYYIVNDNYVSLEEGTGVVHIAPAFGQDDYNVGRRYNLPFLQLVDQSGHMTYKEFEGLFVKDADEKVIMDLKTRGLLFRAPNYEHSYPFCWRCNTPLIYYARDSWFIEMTKVKDQMIANNKKINWIPESIGTGRFGNWLENLQDWGLSRNRYWGTPLPIWENDKTHHRICIGSIAELDSYAHCGLDIELHRPYIDEITWEADGGTYRRVEEVIDCWFDSGSMPFAQFHYPFENQELFKSQFPANFISEAIDQTRGWFYTLCAISTLLFDDAPFKNCIVLGLVLDEHGQKMSKSKGNGFEPMTALNALGADATRWFFYSTSAPWVSKNISMDAIKECQKKFLNTLYNTYSFFVLYADIDGFDRSKYTLSYDSLNQIDKWLLSKLNTLVKEVTKDLDEYKIAEPARAIEEFTDQLSNWYVRRNRERFWGKGLDSDKVNAYLVLYETLTTLSKLLAPFTPFLSEEIYQNLVRNTYKDEPISVHLCDYPKAKEEYISKEIESDMDEVLEIVSLGRTLRAQANQKNRQPLSKMFVVGADVLNDYYASIIKDELNVHEIDYKEEASEFIQHKLKLNLRNLGRVLGSDLPKVKSALDKMNQEVAFKEMTANGKLVVEGREIASEDILVETVESQDYPSLSSGKITIVLDTILTDELIKEGYVRELTSKIQSLRKEAGFEVTDHIALSLTGEKYILDVMEEYKESITSKTLADKLVYAPIEGAYSKDQEAGDYKFTLGVKKI